MARNMVGMSTYVDDVAVTLEGESLAAKLASARESLSASGRMVVEVRIDGESLAPEDLEAKQHEPPAGELRIYSADPRALVAETVRQARAQLEEAAVWQQEAAEALQQDNQSEAMGKISQAFAAWQQTEQVVQQTAALLGLDLDQTELAGQKVPDLVQGLLERLTELRELITAGDTVSLADALAYEWPELTSTWINALDDFARMLEEPQQ